MGIALNSSLVVGSQPSWFSVKSTAQHLIQMSEKQFLTGISS